MQQLFQSRNDYTYEPFPAKDGLEAKYIAFLVHGPKAEFTLWRNAKNPHAFFVMNSKHRVGNIRGYEWFTDKNGYLQPMY